MIKFNAVVVCNKWIWLNIFERILVMKRNLKKLVATSIILILCLSMCLSTVSFAAVLENVVFYRNTASQLPSSGSTQVTLSGNPTMFGYIALPLNGNQTGKVNVTFTQTARPQISWTVTLTSDGKYHTVDMSNWGIRKGSVTVSYNTVTVPLNSISITFGN